MIILDVVGNPVPAGSKTSRALSSKRGVLCKHHGHIASTPAKDGQVWVRGIRPVIVTTDSTWQRGKAWREAIAAQARSQYDGPPLDVPVRAHFAFYLPRPKSHFGSGRNARTVKPSAPQYPGVKPDALKLARAVEDALTGILWKDDALICEERLAKYYGVEPGVQVMVEALE